MPFCPKCKYEYQEGFTECSDCGEPLVPELTSQDTPPTGPEEELVAVFMSSDRTEADIVRGILEEAGIPVIEEHLSDAWSLSRISPLADVSLLVEESQLDTARRIIEDAIESGKHIPQEPGPTQP